MSSSSRDSAARLRELTNKTLTDRAQTRERAAQDELTKLKDDLADSRRAHRQSNDEADEQLKELCVAFDTLIEFILMNHGAIPDKLIEIIAARQEQRIEASLPKADFINQGVQEGDGVTVTETTTTRLVVGSMATPSQMAKVADGLLDQVLKRPSGKVGVDALRDELLARFAKGEI